MPCSYLSLQNKELQNAISVVFLKETFKIEPEWGLRHARFQAQKKRPDVAKWWML